MLYTYEAFDVWNDQSEQLTYSNERRKCCMCSCLIDTCDRVYVRSGSTFHMHQCISRFDAIIRSRDLTLYISNDHQENYLSDEFQFNVRAFEEAHRNLQCILTHLEKVHFEWSEYTLFQDNKIVYRDTNIITFSL